MIAEFEDLLKQLSRFLHMDLRLDSYEACTIQATPFLKVQMQLDTSGESLWLFSPLIETPPGKFRENILKEALKFNARPDPCVGILCYISSTNELGFYNRYPLQILNGEILGEILSAFLKIGESWQEAIRNGQSSPFLDSSEKSNPPNPFGLK